MITTTYRVFAFAVITGCIGPPDTEVDEEPTEGTGAGSMVLGVAVADTGDSAQSTGGDTGDSGSTTVADTGDSGPGAAFDTVVLGDCGSLSDALGAGQAPEALGRLSIPSEHFPSRLWHGAGMTLGDYCPEVQSRAVYGGYGEGDTDGCWTEDGSYYYEGSAYRDYPIVSSDTGYYFVSYTFNDWFQLHDDVDGLYRAFSAGSTYQEAEDGPTPWFEYDGALYYELYATQDYAVDFPNGSIYHDLVGRIDTERWTWSGYFYVIEADGIDGSGDFCVEADLNWVEACASEPDGTFVVSAAQEIRWTLDGATHCDGCGAYTVDGVDAGTACW